MCILLAVGRGTPCMSKLLVVVVVAVKRYTLHIQTEGSGKCYNLYIHRCHMMLKNHIIRHSVIYTGSNFLNLALAFLHQGQFGIAGHRLVRQCPAVLKSNSIPTSAVNGMNAGMKGYIPFMAHMNSANMLNCETTILLVEQC
jgi:hypothetical protein